MRLEAGGDSAEGVTAIVQNSDPFTYFGNQPLRVCEGAELDNGTLSVAMLSRAAQRDVPTVAARVLMNSLRTPAHRQIDHFEGVTAARIDSMSRDAGGTPRPFPVQVDGDYIGDHGELELGIEPGALTIVA
jgi:diacylglycerol kinase family enzyme